MVAVALVLLESGKQITKQPQNNDINRTAPTWYCKTKQQNNQADQMCHRMDQAIAAASRKRKISSTVFTRTSRMSIRYFTNMLAIVH
jgi:hypothetical protein